MNRLLPLLLLPAIWIMGTFTSMGQVSPLEPVYEAPPIYLGPVFGYNRSMHSVDLPSFAEDALCPVFTGGNENGFYLGLSYEHHIGEAAVSNSSIIGRVLYSTLPAAMSELNDKVQHIVYQLDGQGNVIGEKAVTTSSEHIQNIEFEVISLEVMYKINPFEGIPIGFTAGPAYDYVMTSTWEQQYKITEPNNVRFVPSPDVLRYEDNGRTAIIKEGDILDANSYRIALKAGVQYEILMAGGFYIVPAVYYNFGLTKVSSEFDWGVNALQVGVDIRFAITPPF